MADYDFDPAVDWGDSLEFSCVCKRLDGSIIDMSGGDAEFTVRKNYIDTGALPLLKVSTADDISIPAGTDGVVNGSIDSATMYAKLPPGNYVYDLVAIEATGKRSTQLKGKLPIARHPNPV